MANIVKDEAIVLRKTDFRDSSIILQIYSKDHGKISALVKGARSQKSRIGSKIDLINHVEVVFYQKEEKELQLITQVNLINHFPKIKDQLEKVKYASGVCELILKLIPENEVNEKIFRGTVKILNHINASSKPEIVSFAQFLLFFIKEIGYEIEFYRCSDCGNSIEKNHGNAFSYSSGIICESCNEESDYAFQLSEELFNLFKCLTLKSEKIIFNKQHFINIVAILEKFLVYHNNDFKGIKSLQLF